MWEGGREGGALRSSKGRWDPGESVSAVGEKIADSIHLYDPSTSFADFCSSSFLPFP